MGSIRAVRFAQAVLGAALLAVLYGCGTTGVGTPIPPRVIDPQVYLSDGELRQHTDPFFREMCFLVAVDHYDAIPEGRPRPSIEWRTVEGTAKEYVDFQPVAPVVVALPEEGVELCVPVYRLPADGPIAFSVRIKQAGSTKLDIKRAEAPGVIGRNDHFPGVRVILLDAGVLGVGVPGSPDLMCFTVRLAASAVEGPPLPYPVTFASEFLEGTALSPRHFQAGLGPVFTLGDLVEDGSIDLCTDVYSDVDRGTAKHMYLRIWVDTPQRPPWIQIPRDRAVGAIGGPAPTVRVSVADGVLSDQQLCFAVSMSPEWDSVVAGAAPSLVWSTVGAGEGGPGGPNAISDSHYDAVQDQSFVLGAQDSLCVTIHPAPDSTEVLWLRVDFVLEGPNALHAELVRSSARGDLQYVIAPREFALSLGSGHLNQGDLCFGFTTVPVYDPERHPGPAPLLEWSTVRADQCALPDAPELGAACPGVDFAEVSGAVVPVSADAGDNELCVGLTSRGFQPPRWIDIAVAPTGPGTALHLVGGPWRARGEYGDRGGRDWTVTLQTAAACVEPDDGTYRAPCPFSFLVRSGMGGDEVSLPPGLSVDVWWSVRGASAVDETDFIVPAADAEPPNPNPYRAGVVSSPGELRVEVLHDVIDDDGEVFLVQITRAALDSGLDYDATYDSISYSGAFQEVTITNSGAMPSLWVGEVGRAFARHSVDVLRSRFDGAFAPVRALAAGAGEPAFAMSAFDAPSASEVAVLDRLAARVGPVPVRIAGAGGVGGAPAWAAWAAHARTAFDSADGSTTVDGVVHSTYLGVDLQHSDWLFGVAGARTEAVGAYEAPLDIIALPSSDLWVGGCSPFEESGDAEYRLDSVLPYARYASGSGASMWAMGGLGTGSFTLHSGCLLDPEVRGDVALSLAALGADWPLLGSGLSGDVFSLTAGADALWHSSDGSNVRGANDFRVSTRTLRVRLDAGWPSPLAPALRLVPRAGVALVADSGDLGDERAAEVVFGVAFSSPSLGADVGVSSLVAHSGRRSRSWTARAGLVYDPGAPGRGARLALRSGVAPSDWHGAFGVDGAVPWPGRRGGAAAGPVRSTFDAELAFAHSRSSHLLTPYVGYALSSSPSLAVARDLRTGVRWVRRPGTSDFALEGRWGLVDGAARSEDRVSALWRVRW